MQNDGNWGDDDGNEMMGRNENFLPPKGLNGGSKIIEHLAISLQPLHVQA